MKKIILIALVILGIFIFKNNEKQVIIPSSSIRFRIIANSDFVDDQMLKMNIKEDINKEIMPTLENAESIDDSRNLIVNNLLTLCEQICTVL